MMDADARNSILENMVPRDAANALSSMDEMLHTQSAGAGGRPQSPEVRVWHGPWHQMWPARH
jgi:hypothetical protein